MFLNGNSIATQNEFSIGTLKAYYDPDLFKENNGFCYLGFKNGLDWSINLVD